MRQSNRTALAPSDPRCHETKSGPSDPESHRHERGGRDRDLDVGLVRGRGANAVVHGDGAERDPCAVRNLRQHEFAGGRAAARPERLRPRTVSHPHLHDDAVRSRARGKEPLRGDLRPTERRGRERDGELGRRRRRGRPLDVEPAAAAYEHRRRQRDGRSDRRTSHRSPLRRSQNSRFPGGSRPGALRRIDSRGQEWAPSRRRCQVSEQLATSDEFVQPAFRNVRLMR